MAIKRLHDPRGFSLPEAVMTTAIVGVLSLGAARLNMTLSERQLASRADTAMTNAAQRTASHFAVLLGKAGDGVANGLAPGKQIIANPPLDKASILFFIADTGAVAGVMDDGDTWMRYRLEGTDVVVETFRADNWQDIVNNKVPVAGKKKILLDDGVRVTRLEFDLYDSEKKTAVAEGYMASWARASFALETGGPGPKTRRVQRKDVWVFLRNVIYARNY